MRATDEIKISLPEGIDQEANDDLRIIQTTKALSKGIRNSIKLKGAAEQDVEEIISAMTVKDINDLLFDDNVPEAPGRRYYFIIEEFLSSSRSYTEDFLLIVDGYSSIVSALQVRVQELLTSGVTHEDDVNNKTSTASYLEARLTSICERTKLLASFRRDFDKVQRQFTDISNHIFEDGGLNSKVQEIDKTIKDLNSAIFDGHGDEGHKTPGIKETVRALSQTVNETKITSDQIMPNIISLMGVFSSVIVVILSLIATSSTWLSNSNETNVLIAFVVPSGIITLAICALTALIRSSIDTHKEPIQPDKAKTWPCRLLLAIGQFFRKWGLWLFIATVTVLIICATTSYCQKTNDDQTHYIVKCLPASETRDDSSADEEAQTTPRTSVQELFIVQEIVLPTGELYLEKIPCTEEDKHSDGFVYYCLMHQRFE